MTAILQRISTTADGGWRIAFDISADEAEKLATLSKYRQNLLQLAVVPVDATKTELDPT